MNNCGIMKYRSKRNSLWVVGRRWPIAYCLLLLSVAVPRLAAQQSDSIGLPEGESAPQEVLRFTEEEAIRYSILNNLELKRESLDLESLRLSADSSFNLFYPSANASATFLFLNEDPAPLAPQNSFSTTLDLQLQIGAAQVVGIERAALNWRAGLISFDIARQQLIANTRKAFYNIIVLQQNIVIAQESLQLAQERLAQTRLRYNAGLIDRYALLSAQVAVENARPRVIEMESRYNSSLRRFNLAIGVPLDTPADNVELIGEINPQIFALDRDKVVVDIPLLNPDLQNLAISETIIANSLSTYFSQFIPSVTVGYQLSPTFRNDFTENFDLFESNNWDIDGGLRITLNIPLAPLIPFSSTWVNISNTSRQLAAARLQQEERRKNLIIQAQSQIDTLGRIQTLLTAKALSVRLTEEALQVADEGYRVGLREILEVRDAQNQVDSARFEYLNEQYNYIAAQIDLALLLGIEAAALTRYRLPE